MISSKVDTLNATLQKIFGPVRDEKLKTPISNFFVDSEEKKKLLTTLKQKNKIENFVIQLKNKKGKRFWTNLCMRKIDDGNTHYYLTAALDITELIRTKKQLERSIREKEILLQEIHHRVKNNLQIVGSLIDLQCDIYSNDESSVFLKDIQNRIRLMAILHDKLYRTKNFERVDLGEYIQGITDSLIKSFNVAEKVKILIRSENVFIDFRKAISCGLIVNELVSNSLKHAFPDNRHGQIEIIIRVKYGIHEIIITDNGIGFPEDIDFRNTKTLGLQLVNMLIEQLNGKINLAIEKGTKFTISF